MWRQFDICSYHISSEWQHIDYDNYIGTLVLVFVDKRTYEIGRTAFEMGKKSKNKFQFCCQTASDCFEMCVYPHHTQHATELNMRHVATTLCWVIASRCVLNVKYENTGEIRET